MRTFDIPGGTVQLRDKEELTVAGSRAIALATRRLPRKTLLEATPEEQLDPETQLEVAVNESVEDATDLMGFPLGLADEDIEAAWAYNDTLLLAYLGSWTLERPLPKTRDDVAELPSDIYSGLNQAIAKHVRPAKGEDADADEFTVDAVENPDSPTGA